MRGRYKKVCCKYFLVLRIDCIVKSATRPWLCARELEKHISVADDGLSLDSSNCGLSGE